MELVHCNVISNQSLLGGAIRVDSSRPSTVEACIFSGNLDASLGDSVQVSVSLTDGDEPRAGEGNLVGDALFVDDGSFDLEARVPVDVAGATFDLPSFIVEAPDFHLQQGSPLVDRAGRPGRGRDSKAIIFAAAA